MADPDSDNDEQQPGPARQRKPPRPPARNTTESHDFDALAASGKLKTLKVPELKAFLSMHKLPVGGKKEDLIARITSYLS
eukprot:scaffold204752_cov20-Prasinocladus_malaysianus.AAC.1